MYTVDIILLSVSVDGLPNILDCCTEVSHELLVSLIVLNHADLQLLEVVNIQFFWYVIR